MKQQNIKFLLALLISMLGVEAFAHDIAVANEDGKTIYYTYVNNNTELAVSFRGSFYYDYSNEYSGNVVIPETVSYDGKTYSVTSIGDYAFYECSGLTSITVPNSVTIIGGYAFSGCSGLTRVTIPNSVTNIGSYAFYSTAWYNNQPEGIIYAGKVVYDYKGTMPSNTSIVLEEGTLGITDYAFSDCRGLTSITIPNSVTNIGGYAFRNCSRLTSITIPNSVTSIENYAFSGCSGLTAVTISNSVANIRDYAFSGCSGLRTVTIPNSVTSIGSYAFNGCSRLTTVSIPISVTSIGESAFYGCSGLASVTIPNSVITIESCTFKDCSSLKFIIIGSGVFTINSDAFANCPNLMDIHCLAKTVPNTNSSAFTNSNIENATLYVPVSALEAYKDKAPWSSFKNYMVDEYEVDYTSCIQNPGFDEDLTWKADGSKKEIVDRSTILSERSLAGVAIDGSLYAIVNPSTPYSRIDGRTLEASNGFVGQLKGWEWVNLDDPTKPNPRIESKDCEWEFFGSVSYDLGETTIPISDNGTMYLTVPARSEQFEPGEGTLYLRAGWGHSFAYRQVVNLPCAVYRLEYWTINVNPNTIAAAIDLSKIICRREVFQEKSGASLTTNTWTKHEFEFIPSSEFTIQFGFQAGDGSSNETPWVYVDGIKLYKIGEADPLKLLKSDFLDAAATCDELLGDALGKGHEGLAGEIGDYKSEIEEMADGDNQTEMEALLKDVNARVEAFRRAIGEIDNVNFVLNKINNLLQNTNYVGKAALQAVYDKVNNYQKNTAGVKNLYALILEAAAECDAAIKTYILSQEASINHPADYTVFIQHPWFIDSQAEPILKGGDLEFPRRFDEDGNDRYIKGSKNSPDLNRTGWYIAGAGGGDQRVNWQCLRSCWNAWKSNYTTTMAVAQDIEGLPNGYYIISADMITGNGNANGTQRVFAQSSVEKKTSTKALKSEGYDYSEWETVSMTANDKVLVVDGKLTIGAEGTGDGNVSDGWFMVTNFHLYYLGPNASDDKYITIGSSEVATFCPDVDVDFTMVNGVKAYVGSMFNRQTGVLTMTRAYDVPAGTGLLLKGEPGIYSVPSRKSFTVASNLLKGVVTATNINATEDGYVNYVLNNGSQGVGFYKVGAAGASLEAGHAYLQIPAETATSRSALKLRFDDEEESTAISDVERQEGETAVYDLQGRRVEQPQRGLYISNGKKVIIK